MRMRTSTIGNGILVTLLACAASLPALAGEMEWPGARGAAVVVERPPSLFGGPFSDLSFTLPPSSTEYWQEIASDFTLDAPATIGKAVWWGFFDEDNAPASETMRVRFYESRLSDGLPGTVVHEESFVNPMRTDTGNVILIDGLPSEYRFEANLGNPISLSANTPYWFSVVQVNDINTGLRVDTSPSDGLGHAFRNTGMPDWVFGSIASSAFQLSTIPEPGTVALFGVIAWVIAKRGTL